MKNIYRFLIGAAAVTSLFSCSFFDVEPQVICSDTFYNSEAEVKYGLAGVYGAIGKEQFYGNYYSLMYANIDDLCYFNRDISTNYLQYCRHNASTSQVYDIWTAMYQGVNNANSFMEAVVNTDYDKDGKYFNEARFLRAYYHFLLAQSFGDVPLRTVAVKKPDEVMCPATPQYDILTWAAAEMEACLELASEEVTEQPSRVTKTTMQGILARVYLFLAGESVKGGDKTAFLTKARDFAKDVIDSGKHNLNPDYSRVFINMIEDEYDTKCHESMWEAEFLGDRSSAENWSNGRIGDLLGLQSGDSNSSKYTEFTCNYAYGQYDGSLKLWDLYWQTDRTADENALPTITDKRQEWNLPPYNYAGNAQQPPYGETSGKAVAGIDKTPYIYNNVSTSNDPTAAQAIRNCGKFRREVQYEGQKTSKLLYTTINYPILRYSDVLLMYAEASNELSGPTQEAYDCVAKVRTRAGIATLPMGSYDKDSFRELVRNERGRELCFESLRRFDLIRWGIYVQEMNKYTEWSADERWSKSAKAARAANMGGYIKPMHVLLPIPAIELGVNKELVQNELWR
ncbi:MAG: RagB/SusD family nutrient uptake outer membrane protein [Candidatus Cryptobacteroides sp.]|nr:RagB/SusD family nutrient uptake outer membrane protein [Candidatus Cryptobacteroides sp.]